MSQVDSSVFGCGARRVQFPDCSRDTKKASEVDVAAGLLNVPLSNGDPLVRRRNPGSARAVAEAVVKALRG
jgi:hypothetical protein